ncbi:MAG: transcriptional regulator [Thermodesulfovibrionales bacterium]|nr:transcriptional regulator [Thermodesulfovibrionales bacterium]
MKGKLDPKTIGKRRDKPAGIAEKVINLLKIINLIEQGNCPSLKRLAEETEVSERSVYRYLNIINFIVPIVFDRQKGGYRFQRQDIKRVIPLSNKEIALLSALSDITRQLGEPLQTTYQGILTRLNSTVREETKEQSPIDIKIPTAVTKGSEYIIEIMEAITRQRQVEMTYHSINTDEITERVVDPYRLTFHEGVWFMYGYCHLRGDYQWFALDRIKNLKILHSNYQKADEREIEKRVRQSWGIRTGEITEVRVRFSQEVAELINRRPSWHESEQREILPSGEIELTFTVSGTEEIKWWIYSWIPYVKVIKPESLKEEIKKDITRFMAEMTETVA